MFNRRNFITIFVSVTLIYGIYFLYVLYQRKYPKVSVILPLYNAEKFINKTIPMLLLSDMDDFEIIAIDDQSSDNTWKMLQEIARQDARIRIFRNEKNLGICGNRNKGIGLARGKYLAMMDQDDVSLPQRLKVSAQYLDEHPDTDIVDVGTILQQSYDKGLKSERAHILDFLLYKHSKSSELFDEDEKDENIKVALLYSLAVPTQSASMIRRSFLDEKNIRYKKGIVGSDDYYLYLDMVKAGAKFHHIPEILAIYDDTSHHSDKFKITQYNETKEAKRQLYEWCGLDYSNYSDLEDKLPPEEFACILLKDLIAANKKSKRFAENLLQKDYDLICDNTEDGETHGY